MDQIKPTKISKDSLFTVDALRSIGEACTDAELASRAIARFGLSAGARFCQKQGIALEDCLAALHISQK